MLRTEQWDGTLIAEQRIDDPEPLVELEALLRVARPAEPGTISIGAG